MKFAPVPAVFLFFSLTAASFDINDSPFAANEKYAADLSHDVQLQSLDVNPAPQPKA
ncbi:hypothetical protein AYI68_g6438, partial [Smittium mucronatum]